MIHQAEKAAYVIKRLASNFIAETGLPLGIDSLSGNQSSMIANALNSNYELSLDGDAIDTAVSLIQYSVRENELKWLDANASDLLQDDDLYLSISLNNWENEDAIEINEEKEEEEFVTVGAFEDINFEHTARGTEDWFD